jgi:fructose-1,6-bisphosphatase
MKKIFIIISLFILAGCTWNYQDKTVEIDTKIAKTIKELELEKQKAEEVIKLIKEDEDKVMSKVLESFLKSEEINIQQELLNTQNRYNDLLGPILEYEHEKVETQTGSTAS